MDKSIIIKSTRHGLSLFINEELSFEEACEKLRLKLQETKKFFGNASMALTLEGKSFSSAEINSIIDIIDEETDLEILAVLDNHEVNDKIYDKALVDLMRRLDDNACEIYPLSLEEDSNLDFKGSVIVLGDVPASAEVHSNGSIFVLGNAYGKLYAGELGNKNSYVYVGNYLTDTIYIGDYIYIKPKTEEKVKKGLFSKKQTIIKENSYLFKLQDDEIIATLITDVTEQ